MASVWKHPKTANLIARFRGPDGRTINRSTGVTDREEALRIAKQLELDAQRERTKQKPDVSEGGISDAISRAGRLARQGRLDPSAARDLINDLLAAAGQETLDAITNRKWCETWRASKAGSVTERTRMKYDQVSRDWLEFLGRKADKPMEIINKADAVAFRDKLAKDGLAARTSNQIVKLVRGIYAEAVEQGHIGRNPFSGVARLREDSDDARREPFSPAEVSALINTAESDWKGLIILAATSGLRLMDAARLQWKSIDLEAEVIRIKTSKTGAKLTLPLHPAFSAWLTTRTRGIAAAPVFPDLANTGGAGKSGLSMAFKRLMDRAGVAAGVARKAGENGRGRTTSKKSFHSFRHFAATQLAAAKVRPEISRAITGHADVESHAGYITSDLDTLKAAVRSISLG